jgi:hypothetical protein
MVPRRDISSDSQPQLWFPHAAIFDGPINTFQVLFIAGSVFVIMASLLGRCYRSLSFVLTGKNEMIRE